MATIKAAVSRAFHHPLVIEDIVLAAPGPGQVEVTLEACAICHSDISFIEAAWGGVLPAIYGHEAVGHVTAAGPGARHEVGTRVLVTLMVNCGQCRCCAGGKAAHCETAVDQVATLALPDGTPVSQGMNCGAFAEKVVVRDSQTQPIPADIPAASAAVLSCGVITGLGAAVNTARIRPGEVVVVIGAGGVGLNAIQGARLSGASRIVAVDMVPDKLDAALDFGATDGILANHDAPWKALRQIAPQGADVVLVSVGALPAYDSALRYLGSKGRAYAVGMTHGGQSAGYEPVMLAYYGHRIEGSLMGDTVLARDIPWMVDLYRQGRLKLDELVSGTWRLDQINNAITDTKSGAARRNVIVF
ncbi:zinc-binding dehydrogenase [Actibacterium sp. 188UL27-1]|uniref:zinc-binding dehydrogenase n=1 Tax=Actibacterium sp. 188UL27-1 TaxID=2786961 RepID=UPI00195D2156|nr:zinc-binding dehydrogenase [Actibacterium sp. 188UL27-1]MBM7066489.1 zinc-binding dehydrogenase [Actibacterium sp. 188UL27-1]